MGGVEPEKVSIEGLGGEESLELIGRLIDEAADARCCHRSEQAHALLDEFQARKVPPALAALSHYFRANAWEAQNLAGDVDVWAWEQPEVGEQILALRRAAVHEGFAHLGTVRQCQILTNLANQLSHIGRSIEALEIYERVLALEGKFAMALGNRGVALLAYARAHYDDGQAAVLAAVAYDSLNAALAEDAFYESADVVGVRNYFAQQREEIRAAIDPEKVRERIDLCGYVLGESGAERRYRRWCLENRLFLNPLNDLGPVPIAARDVLTLPSITTRMESHYPPPEIGFFNQMKQEFASARFLYYAARNAEGPHYSDRGVLLYNTLDYPSYSLAVEEMRAVFRLAYSLFDKISYFLNAHLGIGHRPDRVSFRSLWYAGFAGARSRSLREQFETSRNWPLRGLFWLSKDFFEEEFRSVTEPDAQALNEIRNQLEHKYLQVHEDWATGVRPEDGTEEGERGLECCRIGREAFAAKTLRLLKLARAALVYLSFAVHREERLRGEERGGGKLVMPMPLDRWEDEWKM